MIGRNNPDGPRDPEEKINALEAQAIREELSRTGVSSRSMLTYYGCDRVEDMNVEMWRSAILKLEKRPTKNGGKT